MPEAELALESDETVTVSTDPWLTFTPADTSSTGFIFYPGGRVEAMAYAPPVRAIAQPVGRVGGVADSKPSLSRVVEKVSAASEKGTFMR